MTAFDAQALAALRRGLEHARARDYFAAHDDWEEVWRDLNGQRRMFWQAMIQLVVGAYHYTNGNLRGCRGQWQKALQKCEDLMPSYAAPIPTPLTVSARYVARGFGHGRERSRSPARSGSFCDFGHLGRLVHACLSVLHYGFPLRCTSAMLARARSYTLVRCHSPLSAGDRPCTISY